MGWLSNLFGGNNKDADASSMGSCIACDGTDLAELAPQAYRCNTCGYEGGDGFAEYKANEQVAALKGQSEEALRERALEQLEGVRLMLVGVGGQVDQSMLADAARMSRGIEIGDGIRLKVSVGTGGAGAGLGGALGALGQMEAQEAERMRQQRKMDLLEARAAAKALRQTLAAWSSKDDHDITVDAASPLVEEMTVDESTPDRRLHELQVLVERARSLIAV